MRQTSERSVAYEQGSKVTVVQYQPWISQVNLTIDGDSVWSASGSTGVPQVLSPFGFGSIESRVQAAQQPNPGFFDGIQLPEKLIKPEFKNGFGVSEVGLRGVYRVEKSQYSIFDERNQRSKSNESQPGNNSGSR